ncbi:outer membrane protein assembly factor BamB family protein [Streptomyces sp. TP-A0874]|uniref:outer membrane protein assembly factor BamB family protein n=1 Tax=Streptomyces sp. TP-A0874 TaxID=549819 RepID=UPI0009A087A1|nr:PQQ-binding-like beta-propeller repeat protein [Streptomyces sp. TP-A0874]
MPPPPAGPPPGTPPGWGPADPNAAANPYAQPPSPQYGAAPQYGANPQYGAPGKGPGGSSKKRLAVIIGSAAVALALIAGGVVFALNKSEDEKVAEGSSASDGKEKDGGDRSEDKPQDDDAGGRDGGGLEGVGGDGEAKLLWQQDSPQVPKSGVDSPGLWTAGKTVVKPFLTSVAGYNVSSGDEEWTVELGGNVCAAPKSASEDDKVVVAYEGKKDSCSKVAMIDLKTGKKVWDNPLPKGGGFGSSYTWTSLAISGDAAGVTWFGGTTLLRVSDGKELPKPKMPAGCSVDGYAGGEALLRISSCLDTGSKLEKVDPANGKTLWSYQTKKEVEVSKIFSTSPAVVSLVGEKDRKGAGVVAVDDKGKLRSELDLGQGKYQPACGMLSMNDPDSCRGIAADADTLYLPTAAEKDDETFGRSNEIHAFDLDTGKVKWKASPAEGATSSPMRTEDGKLIAYQEPTYDESGAILSLDAGDGKAEVLMKNPAASVGIEDGFYSSVVLYEDGRFYIGAARLTGDEKLLVAFGED